MRNACGIQGEDRVEEGHKRPIENRAARGRLDI